MEALPPVLSYMVYVNVVLVAMAVSCSYCYYRAQGNADAYQDAKAQIIGVVSKT